MDLTDEQKQKVKAQPDGAIFSLGGNQYVKRGNALHLDRPLGTQSVLSPEESRAALPAGGKPAPRAFDIPPPFPGKEIKQGVPSLLRTVQEWAPLLSGMGAAAVTLPVATALTGATAGGGMGPAIAAESAAYAGGEQVGDLAARGLTKALGYPVPEKSATDRLIEMGGSMATYPLAGAAMENAPRLVKGFLGIPRRQKLEQKAADKAAESLSSLHPSLLTTAETTANQAARVRKQAETSARQAAREEKAGVAPALVRNPPSAPLLQARAESLAASAEQRQADVAPIERLYDAVQKGLGAEYDALLSPYLKEKVSKEVVGSLGERAAELRENNKQYAVKQRLGLLIRQAEKWGKSPTTPTTARIGGDVIQLPPGLLPPGVAKKQRLPRWEDLKRMRDELRPFFTDKHPPTRNAARQLDAAITDAYTEGGLPINPELNKRYRDWRDRWPVQAIRTLHGARTPEQLKSIVNEDTMGPLLRSGDPEARQAVSSVVQRIISSEQLTPEQIAARFSPQVLRDIFGPGADRVSRWATLNHATSNLEDIMRASPAIAARYRTEVDHAVRQEVAQGARKVKDQVMSMLGGIGEPASELRKYVSGLTPEEATRFYLERMRSSQFAKDLDTMVRRGAPRTSWKERVSLGSVPFAAGLAVAELYHRGEVTSPYAFSVPIAIGAEALAFGNRAALVRMIESEGMQAFMQTLRRATSSSTRRLGIKQLAKKSAQAYVGDMWRSALQPEEASQVDTDAMQQLSTLGAQ